MLTKYSFSQNLLRAVLLCLGPFLVATVRCKADTVYLKNNKKLIGVIKQNFDDKIILITESGIKTIYVSEIKKIVQENKNKNTLTLAKIAMSNKKFIKAYYLYKKVFDAAPQLSAASKGMLKTQQYLIGANSKSMPELSLVNSYERIDTAITGAKKEGEILANNSILTETVKDKFGIILGKVAGQIKISDIIINSPADKTGLASNDVIISVNSKKASYMGLYDLYQVLSKSGIGYTRLIVERKVYLWNLSDNNSIGFSLWGNLGFRIENIGKNITISCIDKNSEAYKKGLRRHDIITYIGHEPVYTWPLNKIVRRMKILSQGKMRLTVQKTITI